MFLDEGFSAQSVGTRLRAAGFAVERFQDWFCDELGMVRRNVKDPEVIQFCHRKGWLLITRDHEMKNLHREEIRRTEIAIVATAHNTSDDQDVWIAALIALRPRVLREFKNRQRPWFATFSRAAKLTIRTIV